MKLAAQLVVWVIFVLEQAFMITTLSAANFQ